MPDTTTTLAGRLTPARTAIGPLGWLAAALLFPLVAGDFYAGLGTVVGINALLAMGLILLTGYGGQFSLAQAAFYGVGAYGTSLLTVKAGWPGPLAIVVSALLAAAIGYALGRPIFRLRGHFLAMGTLALTEIFYLLVNNLGVTGGSSGFGGIAPLSLFGFSFATPTAQFSLIWVVLGVAFWGVHRIGCSRDGRALKALRGNEAAAAACGVDVQWAKTRALAGSAAIGSIAGSLYAHQLLYVNPPPFGVSTSINVLTIAVLGGLRSPWGAVVGAVLIEAIRQGIDSVLPQLFGAGSVGAGEALALGALLVVILVLRPDGVAGVVASLRERWSRARRTPPAAVDPPAATEEPAADETPQERRCALEATNLVKTFGGVHALRDVSLSLHTGEILAVIGPNGAGKSTLLNLLSGNLPPTSGRVHVDGHDVTGRAAHVVARHGVARTFQTPTVFADMDSRSNIMVGAHLRGRVGLLRSAVPTPAAIRQERTLGRHADTVMHELGLAELRHQPATELSLGQQKLLEVARALAQQPTLLLLDEPGAGLNKGEKQALAQELRRLRRRGLAMLLIEHDMEFVMSLADRVHVLDFGRTLACGTPAEIQDDQAVIDAYLGVADTDTDDDEMESADAGTRDT